MELRHLRYFVAVAEEEHVGRAARRLSISQPPLSRQIHDLEREIGVGLFTRSGRGIRLTEAGRALLEGARATLRRADRAAEDARRAASGAARSISIGFVESTIYGGFPVEVLRRFRRERDDVAVELVPMTSTAQWRALQSGEIGFGFVYHAPPAELSLASRAIWHDDLVLALPAGHRLARRAKIRLRDLSGEPFVWLPRHVGPTFHDDVVVACRRGGLEMKVVQEAAADDTRLLLVAGGVGATFTIRSSRRTKPHGVVLKDVADLDQMLTAYAVWRSDAEPDIARLLRIVDELSAGRADGHGSTAPTAASRRAGGPELTRASRASSRAKR
jgi:DNA-binding transcriptional LysR family regulator